MKKIVLLAFVLVLLWPMTVVIHFSAPVKAEPKTWTVDDDGTADFLSIQEAINSPDVKDGDTIFVYNGTYQEWNLVLDKDNLSLIGENKDNTVIDGRNLGWILIIIAQNVTVTGFTIQNSPMGTAGVFLNHAIKSRISNNLIKNHDSGIYSVFSNGNVIENNWVSDSYAGIILSRVCRENRISNNDVIGNTRGVDLSHHAHHNEIRNNKIVQNKYGISISLDNNSIFSNQIVNNRVGIYEDLLIGPAQGYRIFHNNFINNTIQVQSHNSTNIWDDGYPSGGNYWNDYTSVDDYEGHNQDQPGSDGIADTPYTIDANNTDRFPLMGPINTFDVGTWNETSREVHVVSNSSISDFHLNVTQKTITFNASGPDDSLGFCRVTIPNIIVQNLWQGRYTVLIDRKQPSTIRNWANGTYTYVYFTYLHPEHEITIVLEFLQPPPFWMEWWFWTIVVAGIVVLAGAVYFSKKRKR